MIETDFISFLVLLTISVVVSAVLHYGLKFYITQGFSSFFFKVAIGWVGAWLGSKALGQWWEGLNYGQIYYIPAILGCLAFALLVFSVDLAKTFDGAPNRRV